MKRFGTVGLWLVAAIAAVLAVASSASATSYGVMAWGGYATGGTLGYTGQLGNGSTLGSKVPLGGNGLTNVTATTGGAEFALALLANGEVKAWGGNRHGELGTGTTGPENCPPGEEVACAMTPVAVSGLSEVSSVSAHGYFSLALLANGEVVAWGDNAHGQLGDGTSSGPETCKPIAETVEGIVINGNGACSRSPVAVSGLSEVAQVSAGAFHSLALLKNGKVMAWGNNEAGELGDGTTTKRTTPVEVEGLSEVVAIAAGYNESLALLANGKVMAWGGNAHGQLGLGVTTGPENCSELQEEPCSRKPVEVTSLSGVTALASGYWNELALLSNGTVKAWGNNTQGQVGNGTSEGPEFCAAPAAKTYCSSTPVTVGGLAGVTSISASPLTQLVAGLSNGTVVAWGNNTSGQLGVGTTTGPEACETFGGEAAGYPCSTKPVPVFGLAEVASVTAGGEFGLAVVPTSSAPEFGRCLKVEKGQGRYENGSCTKVAAGEGNNEWYPGTVNKNFTTTGGEMTFEKASGWKVTCKSESGTGTYSGPKTVSGVVLHFGECSAPVGKCTTSGRPTGEIVTSTLSGTLGIEKLSTEGASKNKVALSLAPAEGSFAEFSCSGYTMVIRGSLLGNVTTNTMSLTPSRNYKATGYKQKPEKFEGGPTAVLEASLLGGPFEQTSLVGNTEQTNEEKIEVNTVA